MTAAKTHTSPLELVGRRIVLRTLSDLDYDAWYEVRTRCRDWLVPWEPRSRTCCSVTPSLAAGYL